MSLPTREWNRFENNCPNGDILNTYNQLLAQGVNPSTFPDGVKYQLATYKKGNILQYKSNSSNLTQKQRYSQIAKGMWTNRTTTWATQSDTFTNPNTKSLKQVNNGFSSISPNIINNANVTDVNALCVTPDTTIPESLPANTGSNNSGPVLPPPPPTNGSLGPSFPPLIPVPPAINLVVPDGGTLICNISENPCTGEILNQTYSTDCYPSTDSDVPGPVVQLCWNNGLQTYYPRQRLTYGTSGNKWPTNSKTIVPDYSKTCAPP